MNTTKYIALALFATAAFTSCKDKDEDMSPKSNADVERFEVESANTFHDINVSADADWTVTRSPKWATPMDVSGAAGEKLKLFVQSNFEEPDRTDTLFVSLANGKAKQYVITQLGTLRDPNNGRALTDEEVKLFTCGVGYVIDVFDDNSSSVNKYGVHNSSPFDFGKVMAELRRTNMNETFAEELRYISRTENISGSSLKSISDQLAANGNITVGLEAFKATINGSYSRKSDEKNQYSYAMQEIQHLVKSRYIDGTLMRYWVENGKDVLQEDFQYLVDALKENPNNTRHLKRLVAQYGTHVITYAGIGGELMVTMEMKVDSTVSATDINGALNMGIKTVTLNGNGTYDEHEQKIAKNTTLKLRTIGGEIAYTLELGSTFEDFQQMLRDNKNMDKWIEGIQSFQKPQIIDIQTIPLWDLMATPASREALRKYIMGEYQQSRMSQAGLDYNPGLYRITGFNVTSTEARQDTLRITDIGQEIVASRKVVKGINNGKMSTFIYSGPTGNINNTCAFFVGSTRAKPCKVYFDDKGNVKNTKTITILESKAVRTLYIDGTGDITIAPKGDDSLYKNAKFK